MTMSRNDKRFNKHTDMIDKRIGKICNALKKRKEVKSAYPGPISNGKKGLKKLKYIRMNGGAMLEVFISGMSQKIPVYIDAQNESELNDMIASISSDIKKKFDLS